MSAVSATGRIAAVFEQPSDNPRDPKEEGVIIAVEPIADGTAPAESGNEPNVGRSTAETVTGDVALALLDVQQAGRTHTASLCAADALAEYLSSETA
ncbi:hypothetical protein Sa4125_37070 [Aureimonas sp. SA4125]|uniref:hypothetical protein n=1 Tax=Aureimonas sp. SA4125 TaxID=2826993 RepID=UPI001CC4BDAB|nr:hypothetical protein [Aureimonas sp. SA4125]BDA86165.1 hypothetical protein Sa4125_37070 [Aureimonas sp. SA4125]